MVVYRPLITAVLLCSLFAQQTVAADTVIVVSPDSASNVQLAAREVARYVYLRTGELLPVYSKEKPGKNSIRLQKDITLGPQSYRMKTGRGERDSRTLILSGGSDVAVLYAAYHFAEKLGVRFYLHGDVVPDQKILFLLPDLDETHSPLFETRGLVPFHDFAQGPDWWEADDYKAYFNQMAKMRMNFMGLHCYPEGMPGPEPLIWIGHPDDVDDAGKVSFSSPSFWQSTMNTHWGNAAVPTSRFAAGAGLLFPEDDYGPDVTRGHRPIPKTPEGCNEVFNRTAVMLRDVFSYGRNLGMKICVGTETPLTIPSVVQAHLREKGLDPNKQEVRQKVYEGMFTRIKRAYPIDYYWLWTPESWTWHGAPQHEVEATARDIQTALAAWNKIGKPFGFGTCGWELGPKQDRGLFDKILPKDASMSCINRNIGFNWVDQEFLRIKDRPKWAIPWLEDDGVLVLPELWAGRTRRDAADALSYGCTGLMANHWRSKILSPSIASLAMAGWSQDGWNPDVGKRAQVPNVPTTDVSVGGSVSTTSARIQGTDEAPVYQTARYDLSAYRLTIPNGTYDVTLKFCENAYDQPGKRVFGVTINGTQLVERLDVAAVAGKNKAYDLVAKGVRVVDESLNIEFKRIVENPFISGIVINGMTDDFNQFKSAPYTRRINCGGGVWNGYVADLPPIGELPPMPNRKRDLPCADLYADMCAAWFGSEAGAEMAKFFTKIDGDGGAYGVVQGRATLPRPEVWLYGPGAFVAISAPWSDVSKQYVFVDELAALRTKVKGTGNLERFDYWLNTFRYMRSVAEVACSRGALNSAMDKIKAENDVIRKKELAASGALPARIKLARAWEKMMTYLLAATDTPGEFGTIANLEQSTRGALKFIEGHDKELAGILGDPLDKDTQISSLYRGEPRIIVPTQRSVVLRKEKVTLKVILLDNEPAAEARLFWRSMGKGWFKKIPMRHVARGVYEVALPEVPGEGVEYYLRVKTAAGREMVWPTTAPSVNQTLVQEP